MKKFCKNLHLYKKEETDLRFIHEYFDYGFPSQTKIKLLNGKKKDIYDIEVGDFLKNGEQVYGIVKLKDTKNSFTNLEKTNVLYHILTDSGSFEVKNSMSSDYNSCIETFVRK